jgi:carbon-monoxide dehydrogenase small subunit
MTQEITVDINGTEHELSVEPRTLLVHAIRDQLGYTGPNVGCESSLCGACTIHMDGKPVKSCTVLAVQAAGSEITTVEGVADVDRYQPLRESFQEHHALQCGYCTPGMIMSSVALLERNPDPDDEEIREALEGNLCRCTGYQNIVSAVRSAAEEMAVGGPADD